MAESPKPLRTPDAACSEREMVRCPNCDGPAAARSSKHFPFCSARCQTIDLGRWLGEEYRIPDRETGEHELEHELEHDRDD
jgi:endogenous inhibitor of DNA gyrase (YacG/DUF329 family)